MDDGRHEQHDLAKYPDGTMPDPTTIRLDDELKAAVQAEAKRAGISSSKWITQAVVFQLAWVAAVRVVNAGASPEVLGDPDEVARLLANLANRKRPLLE